MPGPLADVGAAARTGAARSSRTALRQLARRRARPCASKRDVLVVRPASAFETGVKIGSGSRSLSRRPAGSANAADGAGRPVLLPARAREVAADDASRPAAPRPAGRASSGRAGRGGRRRRRRARRQRRPDPCRAGGSATMSGRLRRTRTATGRSGRGPCPGSASAGRRRRRTAGRWPPAAAGRRRRAYRSRTLPDRTKALRRSGHRTAPAAARRRRRRCAVEAGAITVAARGAGSRASSKQASRRGQRRAGRRPRGRSARRLAQRDALVGGAQGVALDDRVGLLAATAPPSSTSASEHAAAACSPRPRSMFSRIRSGRTTSPSTRPRHLRPACSRAGSSRRAGARARRDEWLMSRSCQSGWFSKAAPA